MLRRSNATRICILGDMFHARSSITRDVSASLELFFAEFACIEILLVRGNHDAKIGKLPPSWPIEILQAGTLIESVSLTHHPQDLPVEATVALCGHIHPAIRISSRAERLGKLPCFWFSRGQMVLPAIGDFTGTHVVQLADNEQAWFVAENQIHSYRQTQNKLSS